jgi:alkanesulfonate monooxygenase SsuD/methylene tetrahydromethanopterin reductase-like flavin-dependent oxidoreductase (luciferase family)
LLNFGLHVPNFGPFGHPDALVHLATTAERAGWDGLFIWDHIRWEHDEWPVVDPWIALSAVAGATERIRIGPLITPLSRRRPWKVARETVSLDHLSHGRLIFGVGLGWGSDTEFGAFGEEIDDRRRAAMLDEGLSVLSGLWSGEQFSFTGEHYAIQDVTFLPACVQRPRIPVWVAGLWPNRRPFRRAGRWDGAFPERLNGGTLSPEEVADVAHFVRSCAPAGSRQDITISGYSEANGNSFAEYERSGLTWWLERLDPGRGMSLAQMIDLAAAGPPPRAS